MKLFTEEEMVELEGGPLTPEEETRLIEHARELLRIRGAHPGTVIIGPAVRIPEPRESDFWVGPYQEAGQIEIEMRAEGYECVSAAAMAPVHIDNRTTFLIHLHFRKP